MALTTINSGGVKDDSIVNADIKSDAAIAGTKVAPDFGSQAITTTGTASTGHLTVNTGTTNVIADFKSTDDNAWIQFRDDGTDDTGVMIGAEDNDLLLRAGSNERVRIDSSGNVGIGVTPDTWSTGNSLTVGTSQGTIWGAGDQLDISGNAYFNSGWKAAATKAGASQIEQALGNIDFKVSGSVTADAAITWIDALRIESDGDIRIPFKDSSNGLRQKIQWVTESPHFDEVAYLSLDRTATSSAPTDIVLATGTVGSVAERFRITSAGALRLSDTNSPNDANTDIWVADDVLNFNAYGTNGAFIFKSGGSSTERLRIQSGGGISFNGDTSADNALDDYEEGTWTPAPTAGTFSTAVGKYTKIGRLVFCSFEVVHDDGGGNYLQINGLPFSNLADHGANLGTVGYQTGGISPVFTAVTTGTSILFYSASGTAYTYGSVEDDYLRGAVMYNVD